MFAELLLTKIFPPHLMPHVRLWRMHQPTGFLLLLWPGIISLLLASPEKTPYFWLTIFTLGAFFARSAGCIINDLWDRRLDAQVRRTQHRPLASGELSVQEGCLSLAAAGLGAFSCFITLPFAAKLACLGLVPLIVLYPLMKRITFFPQLFLGLTFNGAVPLAWIVMEQPLTWEVGLLYGGFVFWTIGYDTLYGLQDREDDQKAGAKSLPLLLGDATKTVSLSCIVVFSGILLSTIYQLKAPFPLFDMWHFDWTSWACIFGVLAFNLYRTYRLNTDHPQTLLSFFNKQGQLGAEIFFLLWLG